MNPLCVISCIHWLQLWYPSPEMMSSIGLSDNQWLLLKRSILLLHQYSTSHHP
jgi:hypothetical protein